MRILFWSKMIGSDHTSSSVVIKYLRTNYKVIFLRNNFLKNIFRTLVKDIYFTGNICGTNLL